MRRGGMEPTADTYTTLLCGYAKRGDIEAIMKTIEMCEQKELYLLDRDILEVIYSLAVNGHTEHLDTVFGKLRKSIGFNQDAFNMILRLTSKGQVDVAFKILQTMPRNTDSDGNTVEAGNFFVRQMVKAKVPTEKIIKMCETLKANQMNTSALMVAIEASLSTGAVDQLFELLQEAHRGGLEIRQHYFWPVLVAAGKQNQNEVVAVLKRMKSEFGLPATGETVRDYVIPHLNEKSPDAIMNLLISAEVSSGQAASSVAYWLLTSGKVAEAAAIASQYRASFSPNLFRKPLMSALASSRDVPSFIKFVRLIRDSFDLNSKQTEDSDGQQEAAASENRNGDRAEIVGQMVVDVLDQFKSNSVAILSQVLEGLIEEGLSIGNKQAEIIQNRLASEMTTDISDMLSKLTAGDLEPVFREPGKRTSLLSQMSPDHLERFIAQTEAKGESVNRLKRYLIAACFRSKDLAKTEEVIGKLEKEGYVIASNVYAQLIDLYLHHDKLDKALEVLRMLSEKDPEFILDNYKSLKLASNLIANGQLQQGIELLEKHKKPEINSEDNSFAYNAVCWRMLNGFAEAGKVDELNRVFEVLERCNYIEANNVMLGPLIKVHLTNDDLPQAMATFEQITQKYRVTPWKNELACRLIQSEDAANLQKLTDLSTNVHGEVNSLYDLVFSFVECGRIRQARRILETPGLKVRYQRINHACERYRENGKQAPLEGLIEAMKNLHHIDRTEIYHNLLLSYKKENEPQKALELWMAMQEEDVTPPEKFLQSLAGLLRANKMPVPFTLDSGDKKSPKAKEVPVKTESIAAPPPPPQPKSELRSAIKAGNVALATELFANPPALEGKLNVIDRSRYIELLVRHDRVAEATDVVNDLLAKKKYPLLNHFRFYLNKLAANGDHELIEKIGDQLSADLKRQLSFDNRLCHAYIVASKADEYLGSLEQCLEQAKTDKELEEIGQKFPRGGAVGILEKHPEMAKRCEYTDF